MNAKTFIPGMIAALTDDELDLLEQELMARTIEQPGVPIELARTMVDKYLSAVKEYGSPLMKQEAACAIHDMCQEEIEENGSPYKALAMNRLDYKRLICAYALRSFEAAWEGDADVTNLPEV